MTDADLNFACGEQNRPRVDSTGLTAETDKNLQFPPQTHLSNAAQDSPKSSLAEETDRPKAIPALRSQANLAGCLLLLPA